MPVENLTNGDIAELLAVESERSEGRKTAGAAPRIAIRFDVD